MTSERAKAMDNLIAQDADLIEFMASDAACYLYPDEGQKAERAAYTRGCAEQAAELAKFKALAETLAEAVREIKDSWDWWQVDTYDRCSSVVEDAINEALREYKETRDAS